MNKPHFIYLFASWQTFGLFPVLAIMNNAAKKVCLHIFVGGQVFTYFSWIGLGVELLGCMISLCLNV